MKSLFWILYCICTSSICVLITRIFAKKDEELKKVHKNIDLIIMYTIVLLIQMLNIFLLKEQTLIKTFFLTLIINYLAVSSYTDQKIMQLFRMVNVIMLGISAIFYACIFLTMTDAAGKWLVFMELLLSIIVYCIAGIRHRCGIGDVFVLIICELYAATTADVVKFVNISIFLICGAIIIFSLINIKDMIKKNRTKKPFVLSIAIAFYIIMFSQCLYC